MVKRLKAYTMVRKNSKRFKKTLLVNDAAGNQVIIKPLTVPELAELYQIILNNKKIIGNIFKCRAVLE